jgi:lipopolysaccharide transport system permease protein
MANPISPVVETFRYAFMGSGSFSPASLGYSFACTVVLLPGTCLIEQKKVLPIRFI